MFRGLTFFGTQCMSNASLIGSFVWVYFYLLRLFNFCLINLCCVRLPYTMVKQSCVYLAALCLADVTASSTP